MDFSKEYSEKFDELRKNRVKVGFYKYGPAAANYEKGVILWLKKIFFQRI